MRFTKVVVPLMLACLAVLPAVRVSADAAASPALSARGSLRVGVRTLTVTDAARKRPLTLEVWYPAKLEAGAERTVYRSTVGATPYALEGRAGRDAVALEGKFPLLVYSHGQPGTRLQTVYLLEHLASQGFVVAAIDHTEATYADLKQESYVSGLVNRPLDILFVASEVPKAVPSADGGNVGLIGYSYGGYSSLNAAGIGLDRENLNAYCKRTNGEGPCFVQGYFGPLEAARGASVAKPDPRIKAVFVMAPYGGPWLSPKALEAMRVPLFVGVGTADAVATPARDGVDVFTKSGSGEKFLLSLEAARHNPWVVCPPEIKANATDYDRCSEPAWDHAASHALTQHFATAFFGRFLQGKADFGQFLTPALEGLPDRARVKLEAGKAK